MLSALSNNKCGSKCAREKCEEDLGIPWPKYIVIEKKKDLANYKAWVKYITANINGVILTCSLCAASDTNLWGYALSTLHNDLLYAHGDFAQYMERHLLSYVISVTTLNAGQDLPFTIQTREMGLWVTTAQASLSPKGELWLELVSPVPLLPYLRRFKR